MIFNLKFNHFINIIDRVIKDQELDYFKIKQLKLKIMSKKIDPKDIETWNTKSSSHTGGGGSGENNGSNPNNPGGNGNGSGNNNGGPNGPVEPDPNWGAGGFSLDRP